MKTTKILAMCMATAMVSSANAGELTVKELALVDIGAATARGEQDKLAEAFKAGFAEGLTLNEAKEVVGQLYAYCGFPRALNAAATLMTVADSSLTQRRGEAESAERNDGGAGQPFVLGDKSLEIGTANQTKLCGREVRGSLFDFHPQLDAYLKAHLFGDIFQRGVLDWRTREIITVAALAARPETEPQMKAHIATAKVNGVTDAQAAAIVRRVQCPSDPSKLPSDWSAIPVGEPNTAYAKYFSGRSYLHKLTLDQVPAFGVTFEPNCRNNWHIHHAKTGGGQILIVTAGEGYYQEWGKEKRRIRKGDTVNIPAGVKHWHGAADSWFQHIALEVPGTETRTEWLEAVATSATLPPTAATKGENKMQYVTLDNGMKVPQLGFGTWTLKGDVAKASVKCAIETGFRLIDSAQGYGNEADVWAGVAASGIDRKEVFLTTKIAPNVMREGTVRESIDASLAAFGGTHIDLLLIHWPVKGKLAETWKIMEEYVRAGKVRMIGLSNCNPHHIDEILAVATIKPVVNQVEIHPYMTQQEVAGATFAKGLQVESWGPLGQGTNGVLKDPEIAKIAAAHSKSIAQVIIRWHLQRGLMVIPRSDKPAEIAEDIAVFDFELTPREMQIINGLNRNERTYEKNDPETFPW